MSVLLLEESVDRPAKLHGSGRPRKNHSARMGSPLGLRPPSLLIHALKQPKFARRVADFTPPSTYSRIGGTIIAAVGRPPQRVSLQEKIACPQLDVAVQLNLEVMNTVAVQIGLDNGMVVLVVPCERASLLIEQGILLRLEMEG